MKLLRTLILVATCLLSTQVLAGESITVDYQFTGDTGVNLGAAVGGPIRINEFSDARNIENKADIIRSGKDSLTLSSQSPSALVREAFTKSFAASGAAMGEDGGLVMNGKLVDMQVEESADGIEVLIRCELSLSNQGRNAWQSTLFSRTTTSGDDVAAAISASLDRLVSELFMDDYFLMELGIF